MFLRNTLGERRLSPAMYKLFLSAHIIAAVGWLGLAVAKIVLEIAAVMSESPSVAELLNVAIPLLNFSFPPAAISTMITGILLSLGTKWGIIDYTWVMVKLVLTALVIITATQLGDRMILQTNPAFAVQPINYDPILGIVLTPAVLLLCLTLAHILMLGAATVISVYKPWGKTWFGRRKAERSRQGQGIISVSGLVSQRLILKKGG